MEPKPLFSVGDIAVVNAKNGQLRYYTKPIEKGGTLTCEIPNGTRVEIRDCYPSRRRPGLFFYTIWHPDYGIKPAMESHLSPANERMCHCIIDVLMSQGCICGGS